MIKTILIIVIAVGLFIMALIYPFELIFGTSEFDITLLILSLFVWIFIIIYFIGIKQNLSANAKKKKEYITKMENVKKEVIKYKAKKDISFVENEEE